MNDRITPKIARPKNDSSQMLAIRFTDSGPTAVTSNMLAEEAKENFRRGLGPFLRAQDAEPDMLPSRSYDDAQPGVSITRDMLGGGITNHRTQMPGLNSRVLMQEFGLLRNAGYFGEQVLFNAHDDDSVLDTMDAFMDVLRDAPGTAGLSGVGLRQVRQAHIRHVVDTAPNLFLFAELIRQSEIVIEQQFTQLYARSLFPILNLNTWLETWMFRRRGRAAIRPAQSVDISSFPARVTRRQSESTVPVPRPLRFYHEGAAWDQVELWRMAEAVVNGAPEINIVRERTEDAINSLLLSENNLAFFGDPAAVSNGIVGLLSPSADTGITHTSAGTKFGAGDPESDRLLLIQASSDIILQTERIYQPNTLAVGTATWLYITETRYGDLANPSDKLVIDVAMDTLRMRGIEEISWVPELGYRPDVEQAYLDQGLGATEAERLAGGIAGEHCMATFRKDPKVCQLVIGKDVTPYPTQTEVLGTTEARYVIGCGGLVFYQPAAVRITADVGPDPAP